MYQEQKESQCDWSTGDKEEVRNEGFFSFFLIESLYLFIYLFIYGCVGSPFLCEGFL